MIHSNPLTALAKPNNIASVGLTDNLERRVFKHNTGLNRSTKPTLHFLIFPEPRLLESLIFHMLRKEFRCFKAKLVDVLHRNLSTRLIAGQDIDFPYAVGEMKSKMNLA